MTLNAIKNPAVTIRVVLLNHLVMENPGIVVIVVLSKGFPELIKEYTLPPQSALVYTSSHGYVK